MGRNLEFFATKQDSLELLEFLEQKSPLFYVRWGYYPSRDVPSYSSAAQIPELGAPTYPRRGEDRYFIFSKPVKVRFRTIQRDTGEKRYVTRPPDGVPWVHLHSGGMYGEDLMVEGIIETAAYKREEMQLFNLLYRTIRKRFTRVESTNMGTSHVGQQALELLRGGMRFVRGGYDNPRDMDFKLPRGWQPE
jgi:hypothetical protein